ncbi:MAG: sulfatase-like hydrolase/transferase, partial [Verrucomicrobiota bacterium]
MTVFLGYWLPLDWMLRGWAALGNTSLLEKFQAIASSVLLNFLPVTLGLTLLVYLGSAFSLLTKARHSSTVRWSMNLVANFIALAATALAMKLLLLGQLTAPPVGKGILLAMVAVLTFWLTARGRFLAQHMVLPRWLALVSLPLALGLVGQEILSQPKPFLAPLPTTRKSEVPRPPDIILVTMDACSSQHLSGYGYLRPTSPHLDAFAQEGSLFEHFYANASWTRPGAASLLNGARPWNHAGDLGRPRQEVTEGQNLLGCLARAGYEVRTVSCNGLADHAWQGTPTMPTETALVSFDGSTHLVSQNRLRSALFSDLLGPAVYIRRLIGLTSTRAQDKTGFPLALAKGMLSRVSPDHPSFFWIHFLLPHDPYAAPAPFLGRFESSPLARQAGKSEADY